MAVVEVPEHDASGDVVAHMVEEFNAKICPDNEKVRPETLDDILEGHLVFRKVTIDLYNSDLDKARSEIRTEAKEEAEQHLRDRLEKDVARAGAIPLGTPEDLKAIIREVKVFDTLKNKFMGRDKFLELCKKENVPANRAELIYISRVFDIETRRRLISENINMLA